MIRKKSFLGKIIFISFSFLVFSMSLQCNKVEAVSSEKNEKVSCGKILSGGDIQVYETVECGKESKTRGVSGRKLYQKQVCLKKQFKKHIKENRYDIKAEVSQCFTFTYDKVGSVTITPEDVSQELADMGWKISPVSEIYINDDVCTVSNKYSVYDKNLVGNYQYVSDGYCDIFCDCNGKIGINSDIR